MYVDCKEWLSLSDENAFKAATTTIHVIVFFLDCVCFLQRACLDPMNSNQYLESASHFVIRLLANSSQFLGTKQIICT